MGWKFVGACTAVLVGCGACSDGAEPADADEIDQVSEAREDFVDRICGGRFRLEGLNETQSYDARIAARRWNAFLGRMHFVIVPDATCRIRPADLSGVHALGGADWDFKHGDIRLDFARLAPHKRHQGPMLQTVIMHEMGHSLGLRDLDAHAVMGRNGKYVAEDFTDVDRAECVRAGACH